MSQQDLFGESDPLLHKGRVEFLAGIVVTWCGGKLGKSDREKARALAEEFARGIARLEAEAKSK